MRLLLFILLAVSCILQASASSYAGLPADMQRQAVFVEQMDLQANSAGTFAVQSDRSMFGDLKAVIYVNGNYTHVGVASLKYGLPGNTVIDSYNITTGTATRAPRIKVAGSTDAYAEYPLFGKLWMNITGGQAWGKATAYIVYG